MTNIYVIFQFQYLLFIIIIGISSIFRDLQLIVNCKHRVCKHCIVKSLIFPNPNSNWKMQIAYNPAKMSKTARMGFSKTFALMRIRVH